MVASVFRPGHGRQDSRQHLGHGLPLLHLTGRQHLCERAIDGYYSGAFHSLGVVTAWQATTHNDMSRISTDQRHTPRESNARMHATASNRRQKKQSALHRRPRAVPSNTKLAMTNWMPAVCSLLAASALMENTGASASDSAAAVVLAAELAAGNVEATAVALDTIAASVTRSMASPELPPPTPWPAAATGTATPTTSTSTPTPDSSSPSPGSR